MVLVEIWITSRLLQFGTKENEVFIMIMTKDNDFSYRENDIYALATVSVIGDRKTQEDCFGHKTSEQSLLLCVCDGMGGYTGGSAASKIAVETILNDFAEQSVVDDPATLLSKLTASANDAVSSLHKINEDAPNAGSTMVLIYIADNLLYWSAVGDSRLYIWRKGEFIQTTKDQNYHTVLKEKRSAGEISEDEFIQGQARGDALVNYLGIGTLSLVDYNREPLKLKSSDQLLICTDGLYRILSDEEISEILSSENDAKIILQMIEFSVRKKASENNKRRDNMTVSLIKIK